jgi:ASC-1-like (ASCH) protein
MKHELKIEPAFFEAVISGDKTFEIRNNADRGFQKGDIVVLKEYSVSHGSYLGRVQEAKITYVCNYNQPTHQVVFSFKLLGDVEYV